MNGKHPRNRAGMRSTHRGISLVIVLVLVLVLGLLASMALRASMFSVGVSGHARSQALATEAAEAALRYCEAQAISEVPAVAIQELPDDSEAQANRWTQAQSWKGSARIAADVPEAILNSADSRQTYGTRAQCLVEVMRLPTPPGGQPGRVFLVTARGFSPDATLDTEGTVRSGAEVWLQSTVWR